MKSEERSTRTSRDKRVSRSLGQVSRREAKGDEGTQG